MFELRQKLINQILECLSDFSIYLDGPVVLGLSGGKDSTLLLILLKDLGIDVRPVIIDLGYKNFDVRSIASSVSQMGYSIEVISVNNITTLPGLNKQTRNQIISNIESLKNFTGNSPCSKCSQIKRQLLIYSAKKYRSKWVALAHHRNDLLTTILKDYFIDLYYSEHKKYDASLFRSFITMQEIDIGSLKSMVKHKIAGTMSIRSFLTSSISLVRPMSYVMESDIIKMVQNIGVSIFGSGCSHDIFTSNNLTIATKREIVHEEFNYLLRQSPNLANRVFEVALCSLDKSGKSLFNPRRVRPLRYPGFDD